MLPNLLSLLLLAAPVEKEIAFISLRVISIIAWFSMLYTASQ
jgi:hypothetical protein